MKSFFPGLGRRIMVLASKKYDPTIPLNLVRSMSAETASIDRCRISDDAAWESEFRRELEKIVDVHKNDASHQESATCLRNLLKTGLLRHTDIVDNPERFFLAHRLIAEKSVSIGPGFWIRFTVHYNLCVGTIVGLGNDEQIFELENMQRFGKLGCFSLTEKFAGVNSGFIVNTRADWNEADQTFSINTFSEGSKKNWISQGNVADKTVVIADLHINNKSVGPHAFIMTLRDTVGNLVPGISCGDMGRKTVGNDLDNAWIAFDNVVVPKHALLNKYADVEEGKYIQKKKNTPVFHMIGQRLFSGRIAVAQAALTFRRKLFEKTRTYTDSKLCWDASDSKRITDSAAETEYGSPLSKIPQLDALYRESEGRALVLEQFAAQCEKGLNETLRSHTLPSITLIEAIAVLKVKSVEDSILMCHKLRNEVGSYALMHNSSFHQTDFLQCCKFAEGDSRILMQKMARDRMKLYHKQSPPPSMTSINDWNNENTKCALLQSNIESDCSQHGYTQLQAWNHHWEEVYDLADMTMNRIMKEFSYLTTDHKKATEKECDNYLKDF